MSFSNRTIRLQFVVVLILLSIIAISASQTFSQNIIISVDSISGQLGDKRIPLDIHISTSLDTIAAFELWLQLSSPDIILFDTDSAVTVDGSVIDTWFIGGSSIGGFDTNLDVTASYPVPDASQYLFPPVTNEFLFRCYVDVTDSFVIPPVDSVVEIWVNTTFLDNFTFSDQYGNTIDHSTIEVNFSTFTLLPTCGYTAGTFDIASLVSLVSFMFGSGPELSIEEADCNCDCLIDVADLVCFVDYMFGGGAEPGCGK